MYKKVRWMSVLLCVALVFASFQFPSEAEEEKTVSSSDVEILFDDAESSDGGEVSDDEEIVLPDSEKTSEEEETIPAGEEKPADGENLDSSEEEETESTLPDDKESSEGEETVSSGDAELTDEENSESLEEEEELLEEEAEFFEMPTVINPEYADFFTEEDAEALLKQQRASSISTYDAAEQQFDSLEDAAAYLRSQMVLRKSDITFSVSDSVGTDGSALFSEIFNEAIAYEKDTTKGYEGDALAGACLSCNLSGSKVSGYYYFTTSITYSATYEQEKELTIAVDAAMESLSLEGKTELEKIELIHDYICEQVDYDYDAYEAEISGGDLDITAHSAYAALCKGKAVCQGYALLFYRMCREADLSVRYIIGTGNGGGHAWNIVRMDDKYYNVDCTWDGQGDNTYHTYLLKNQADFVNHERSANYETEEFLKDYPMAELSYVDTSVFPEKLDKDNSVHEATFDTISGGTITTAAADGKAKVLIFDKVGSDYYLNGLLKSIGNADIKWDGVDFVVIDVEGKTAEEVQNYADAYANDILSFTYDSEDGADYNMRSYINRCTDLSSFTYPIIVYIDANNRIQHVSTSNESYAYNGCESLFPFSTDVWVKLQYYCACAHENTKDVPAVASTCTEQGHEAYTICNDCGIILSGSDALLPLADHTPQEDDGNCLTPVICTVCPAVLVEAKTTHVQPEDDGDCTTAVVCSNEGCKVVLIEAKESHTAGEDDGDCTTPVYCTNEGCTKIVTAAYSSHTGGTATCLEQATCERCGQSYGEIGEHNYDETYLAENADEEKHYHVCKVCGKKDAGEAHVSSGEATDETNEVCTVCGYVIKEKGHYKHTLTLVPAKEATCEEKGNHAYYKCSGCSDLFQDGTGSIKTNLDEVTIPALGHDWADATCTEPKTCTRCGATEGDPKGHSGGRATCTEQAVCEVCGVSYGDLADHTYGNKYESDADMHYQVCTVCGQRLEEGTAHTYNGQYKTDSAMHYPVCSVCGHEGEGVSHTSSGAATCIAQAVCEVCHNPYGGFADHVYSTDYLKDNADAEKHYHICTVCGAKDEGEVHIPGPEATDETDQVCTVCNYILKEKGHYSHKLKFVEEVAATCTEAGTKAYYICEVAACNKKFEDASAAVEITDDAALTIPALGHTWADATCTAPKTCSRCGITEGEALGHSYTVSKYNDTHHWKECVRCGEIKADSRNVHEYSSDSDTTCNDEDCTYEREARVQLRLEQTTLAEAGVAKGLEEAGYNNPAEIEEALLQKVDNETGFERENAKVYEIKLQYSKDGGSHWDDADASYFSNGKKLTVTVSYPEGTNWWGYGFKVFHMFAETVNGKKAGDIEPLECTNEKGGIEFTVSSLSPIAITWNRTAPAVTVSGVHGSVTDIQEDPEAANRYHLTISPDGGYKFGSVSITNNGTTVEGASYSLSGTDLILDGITGDSTDTIIVTVTFTAESNKVSDGTGGSSGSDGSGGSSGSSDSSDSGGTDSSSDQTSPSENTEVSQTVETPVVTQLDNVPATGDADYSYIWLFIAIVAAAGSIGSLIYGKRKEQN